MMEETPLIRKISESKTRMCVHTQKQISMQTNVSKNLLPKMTSILTIRVMRVIRR